MTIPTLGTLIEADLREAWINEAHNFTPWLAENLDALAQVIGIPLELEGQEVAVDTFSADILARNPLNDDLVLIENQLDGTDHSHLGQLMTYLAGLDAKIVIWIAADFREAHLSAVHWLNDHTVDPFAFFAVKVKVVRIGDSPLAPIFDVLARPNQWERHLQVVAKESRELSELGQFRKSFWTHYLERYPNDVIDGEAGADSARWRTISALDIVVSYYLAQESVGVFIRGKRGAAGADIQAILAPHAARLAEATGAEFGDPSGDHFFVLACKAKTADRSRWDELTDWLHEKVSLYTEALQGLEANHGE